MSKRGMGFNEGSHQSGVETSLGLGAFNGSTSVNISNRRDKLRTQGDLGFEASSVDYANSIGFISNEKSVNDKN